MVCDQLMPGCSDPWEPETLAETTTEGWLGLLGPPLFLPTTNLSVQGAAQESPQSRSGGGLSTHQKKQSSQDRGIRRWEERFREYLFFSYSQARGNPRREDSRMRGLRVALAPLLQAHLQSHPRSLVSSRDSPGSLQEWPWEMDSSPGLRSAQV